MKPESTRGRGRRSPYLLAGCLALALAALPAFAQSTIRVDLDAAGAQLTNPSVWGTISADGRFAAFVSDDPNVVAGDTNGTSDVFVKNLATGAVVRASVTAGGVEANGPSFEPKLSRDGHLVAFSSWATNLSPADRNGTDTDVFVKDLRTGALEQVSVNSAGVGGNAISAYIAFSANGRFVTYYSYSTNLVPGDTNGALDVFGFDRTTRTTERISVTSSGAQLSLPSGVSSVSDDGRFVAFEANGSDFGFPSAGGVIALRDRQAGTTRVVNMDSTGAVRSSYLPKISGDGRYVAFATRFSMIPADTNFDDDVYLVDTTNGALDQVSAPPAGLSAARGSCSVAAVSRDGRFVAFSSDGVFDGTDTNGLVDAFVRDRARGRTERVSIALGGLSADDRTPALGMSGDGRYVVFGGEATNLVIADTNGVSDIFVRDRCPAASATNYGTGLPGTNRVTPAIGVAGAPAVGTTPALALGNSAGTATAAVLVLGSRPASIPTPFQGTLLVAPLDVRVFSLPAAGLVVPFPIPYDLDLCGTELRLQNLVLDGGAPAGLAFSRGLQIVIGG